MKGFLATGVVGAGPVRVGMGFLLLLTVGGRGGGRYDLDHRVRAGDARVHALRARVFAGVLAMVK